MYHRKNKCIWRVKQIPFRFTQSLPCLISRHVNGTVNYAINLWSSDGIVFYDNKIICLIQQGEDNLFKHAKSVFQYYIDIYKQFLTIRHFLNVDLAKIIILFQIQHLKSKIYARIWYQYADSLNCDDAWDHHNRNCYCNNFTSDDEEEFNTYNSQFTPIWSVSKLCLLTND
jgi:hypothetical protein